MSAGSLYELVDTLPALLDSLEMTTAGSPGRAECEADIQRYMAALPTKVDSVARFLKHLESQEGLAAQEIRRLTERKRRFAMHRERLEAYVISVLSMLPEPRKGARKLEGACSTMALVACPASLEVYDEAAIPDAYRVVVQTTKIDNAAVKEDLKAGAEVPGARLITDKTRLAIK